MTEPTGAAPTIWSYGIAMMDVVVRPLEEWPPRGGLAVCSEGMFVPGGVALNTAVTVARLGGRSGLIAAIGRDPAADGIRAYLRRQGVQATHLLQTNEASTGFCIVAIAPDGEKSLVAHLGSNRCLTPKRVAWDELPRGDFLHLGGCFALPELSGAQLVETIQAAGERRLMVSLESAWDVSGRWLCGVEHALHEVRVFMASDNEAQGMTGLTDPEDSCRALAALGPEVVVVKAGAGGCYLGSRGDIRHLPAYDVRVIDATGAGDSFCGAFLLGIAQDRALGQAADFANAVAAMNVTAVGSTAGVRDLETTLRFMAATPYREAAS